MSDEPGAESPFRKPPPGWGSHQAKPAPVAHVTPAVASSAASSDDAALSARRPALTPAVIGRGVALAILTYLTVRMIFGGLEYPRPGGILTIIDGANFIFHEAGHFIFSFFGEFIAVLGGSLNQVLIPAIFTGYFFWYRQPASACATLFWAGQSMTGVAVYAADAQAMRLPLHGGEGPNVHDWHRLLLWTGLLDHATAVGRLFFTIAVLTMLAALVISALDLLRVYQNPDVATDAADVEEGARLQHYIDVSKNSKP